MNFRNLREFQFKLTTFFYNEYSVRFYKMGCYSDVISDDDTCYKTRIVPIKIYSYSGRDP